MGHVSSTEKYDNKSWDTFLQPKKDDNEGFSPAHVFAVVENTNNTEEVNLSQIEQAPFTKIGLITSDKHWDMSLIPGCNDPEWGSFCTVVVCSSTSYEPFYNKIPKDVIKAVLKKLYDWYIRDIGSARLYEYDQNAMNDERIIMHNQQEITQGTPVRLIVP